MKPKLVNSKDIALIVLGNVRKTISPHYFLIELFVRH